MISKIKTDIQESIMVKEALLNDHNLIQNISDLADCIAHSISKGNKLVICGNGGSASDALHFAGEIVGRFQIERNPWPAVVLNADVATMTAIANDYGYDSVFERQAKAHIKSGDVFIGISTSGNSENVYKSVLVARALGAYTGALLGKDGGKIMKVVDYPIVVPSNTTARIQESHITIIHSICDVIENELTQA